MISSSERSAVNSKKTGEDSMLRKIVVCLLLTVFLHTVAEAQQAKKVTRIGYLTSVEPATESTRAEGIRLALRELGYLAI